MKKKPAQKEVSSPTPGEEMKHHETLAPSSFPSLVICSHFESDGKATKYTERGKRIHDMTESCLSGFSPDKTPDGDCAKWMAIKTLTWIRINEVKAIGKTVYVRDELSGDVITFGTPDIWGDGASGVTVIDWKTGIKRDYRTQLYIYALAIMDDLNINEATGVVLYCDEKKQSVFTITRRDAEQVLTEVLANQANPDAPYVPNEYCSRCKLRQQCPEWLETASEALSVIAPTLEEGIRHGLELVKSDPDKLGEFLDGWRKAQKLVDDAGLTKEAIRLLELGTSVGSFEIQERSAKKEYPKEAVATLLLLADEIGVDDLSACLKVIPDELEALFSKIKKPCPVEPVSKGKYKCLVQKKTTKPTNK